MNFPAQIKIFLSQVGADDAQRIAIVPKSESAGTVDDVMIFRYKNKGVPGKSGYRVLVLKKPIVKEAKTGNLLLTGVVLPIPGDYTPESLGEAFVDQIPEDSYRTYIMSRILGPLYRVR